MSRTAIDRDYMDRELRALDDDVLFARTLLLLRVSHHHPTRGLDPVEPGLARAAGAGVVRPGATPSVRGGVPRGGPPRLNPDGVPG